MPKLVSFIIPAYNEREYIGKVLEAISSVPLSNDTKRELIVVDDGSTDGTADYVESRTDIGSLRVYRLKENSGKGAALRAGFELAEGDVIMVCDADLEYSTDDIPRIVEPIIEGKADIVYGSRFLGSIKGMKKANLLANKILTVAVNVLFKVKITDEATAYKAFSKDVLQSVTLRCSGFEFCPEVTAKTLKRGYQIIEVPVTYEARSTNEGKKIRWQDGFVALWTLLKYRFSD